MAWDGVQTIEILMGREGIFVKRNTDLVPLGAFRMLRNATLEDDSVRTGAGAVQLGDAIGSVTVNAAIDYFPALGTQRTVVMLSDGTLRKDNGAGASWATLASALTTTGAVPHFTLGGIELAGRSQKLFYCDRVNAVQVLAADGGSTAALANPPADWSGANQPGFLFPHSRFLWGGGNANASKTLYRSIGDDHEQFLQFPYFLQISGEYERLVAGLSFKGGALVFGYPEGAWFINTANPAENAWRPERVSRAGCAGPWNVTLAEDDVLWVSPDGSWHAISATEAQGSARATDLAYRKLGSFVPDRLNLAQLATAQLVWHAQKQIAMLAAHGAGVTLKNRRIDFDLRRRQDSGERWVFWDRDRNEALFMRKKNEVLIPAFGDAAGTIWELDQASRNVGGTAYTFEWELNDTDFAQVVPGWSGRKKNGRFIQLVHDPRQAATHTVEAFRDGAKTQTIQFSLSGAGSAVLPAVLPVALAAGATMKATTRRRLLGQAIRWGFRGYSSGINADVSVTKLILGLELAA